MQKALLHVSVYTKHVTSPIPCKRWPNLEDTSGQEKYKDSQYMSTLPLTFHYVQLCSVPFMRSKGIWFMLCSHLEFGISWVLTGRCQTKDFQICIICFPAIETRGSKKLEHATSGRLRVWIIFPSRVKCLPVEGYLVN